MHRRILIIDDHDDLASSLQAAFSVDGHETEILKNRADALAVDNIEGFDLVITDLDVDHSKPDIELYDAANSKACIPAFPESAHSEHIKAFKICATNFRRDDFDENELKSIVETVLNYKIRYVDDEDFVRQIHEKIEFELPSAISPMYSILEYLIKRVEKLGVINSSESNLFVALDEAFVNAVKHGNKYDAGKLIRITAELSQREACFTVEDEGEGFDVNSIPDPLDPENLFKTSGRGVLFICNIMDEVKYNERGNRITMVKRCNTKAPHPNSEKQAG